MYFFGYELGWKLFCLNGVLSLFLESERLDCKFTSKNMVLLRMLKILQYVAWFKFFEEHNIQKNGFSWFKNSGWTPLLPLKKFIPWSQDLPERFFHTGPTHVHKLTILGKRPCVIKYTGYLHFCTVYLSWFNGAIK